MQREYKKDDRVMVMWSGDEDKMDGPHTILKKEFSDSYIVTIHNPDADNEYTTVMVPSWWIRPYRDIDEGRPCVAVDEVGRRFAYGNYAGDSAIDTGGGAVFVSSRCTIEPIYKKWEEIEEEEQTNFKTFVCMFLRLSSEHLTSLQLAALWDKVIDISSEEDF